MGSNERNIVTAADCMISDIREMLQGKYENSYATENHREQVLENNDDEDDNDDEELDD